MNDEFEEWLETMLQESDYLDCEGEELTAEVEALVRDAYKIGLQRGFDTYFTDTPGLPSREEVSKELEELDK